MRGNKTAGVAALMSLVGTANDNVSPGVYGVLGYAISVAWMMFVSPRMSDLEGPQTTIAAFGLLISSELIFGSNRGGGYFAGVASAAILFMISRRKPGVTAYVINGVLLLAIWIVQFTVAETGAKLPAFFVLIGLSMAGIAYALQRAKK